MHGKVLVRPRLGDLLVGITSRAVRVNAPSLRVLCAESFPTHGHLAYRGSEGSRGGGSRG